MKNRLENESLPLPENDWEWFEAKFRQRKKRRLLVRWSAAAAGIAATVGLLLLMKPVGETGIDVVQVPDSMLAGVTDPPVDIINPLAESVEAPRTAIPTVIRPLLQVQEPSLNEEQTLVAEPVEAAEPTPLKTQESFPADEQSMAAEHDEAPKETDRHEPSLWQTQEPKNNIKIILSPYAGGMRRNIAPSNGDINKLYNAAADITSNYQNAGLASASPSAISSFSKQLSHSIPVSFGLDVSVPLTDKISITSGADLTLYKSNVVNRIEKISQRAYYLGIPLRLEWTAWENGPASAWLGAGGKVDRLVYGKIGTDSLTDNSFHWSAVGVAGIQYELVRGLGLFFQPEISYYFKPSSPAILTYRTENPLMFSIDAGFRINL